MGSSRSSSQVILLYLEGWMESHVESTKTTAVSRTSQPSFLGESLIIPAFSSLTPAPTPYKSSPDHTNGSPPTPCPVA
jgi:hypothetical protein